MLCLLQPTANYDLAIIEDYLAGNAKIKISIKKQNGVVVIFGEPWQLLLTGSAVPRINAYLFLFISQTGNMPNVLTGFRKSSGSIKPKCPEMVRNDPKLKIRFFSK